jgi:hypothetical protein
MPTLLWLVRKENWSPVQIAAWLQDDDLPADALGDLVTKANELNVWFVPDTENSDQTRNEILSDYPVDERKNLSFAFLDISLLETKGFQHTGSQEPSKRKIIKLTASKILELVEHIQIHLEGK